MSQKELLRIYELIDLIEDRGAPSSYFQAFDSSIRAEPEKKQVWLARDAELRKLDADAWEFLKREARPYLTSRDPKRGWEQLVNILNQARAYSHLQTIGCSTLRFVRKGKKKTPDLEGSLNGRKVLCEVKTVNISKEEASLRQGGKARAISDVLGPRFEMKLLLVLRSAKEQLDAYAGCSDAKRIVFVVINFDDSLGEYKAEYYGQIDSFLDANPLPGVKIVFYNERTAFHTHVDMKSATVVNE